MNKTERYGPLAKAMRVQHMNEALKTEPLPLNKEDL
jgi:hypothetical protein